MTSSISSLNHREANIDGPGSWKPHHTFDIFAPCATKIDIKSGTIRDATGSELFKCCVSRCKPKHEFCKSLCHQDLDKLYNLDLTTTRTDYNNILGRCLGNCRIMNLLCSTECRGLSPGFSVNNYYYDCAEENGCPRGLGELPSKECVEKNKDVIFNCCRSNCVPTGVTDCQELCETLQTTILDPVSLGIPANPYPWTSGLEDQSQVIIDEGMKSLPQERQRAEEEAIKDDNPPKMKPDTGNIYHRLLIGMGIGVLISFCVILGVYFYRRKHK